MFPEYRTLVSRLKNEDAHFSVLFHEHNALDAEIKQREMISGFRDTETEVLKKKKLHIKDELYRILKTYDVQK
ncbi:TPA: YdcH family protein [Salmonella enterica subsp. diarizonae serovar 61:l,v:z35]